MAAKLPLAVSLGVQWSRRSQDRPARLLAVALALIAVQFAALAVAVTAVAYDVRAQHDAARAPSRSAALKHDPQAVGAFRYVERSDQLFDGIPFTVMLLQPPQDPDATPPPPGLDRWPVPGEAFLSPQLLEDGAAEGIDQRYGVVAGVIDPIGLSAVDERFAYVAPRHFDAANWHAGTADGWARYQPASWWADPSRSTPGESDTINAAPYPLAMIVLLAALPAGVLLLVARGVGARERRRWQWTLGALGAGPDRLRLARLGELALPALAALAVGGVLVAVTATVSVRLPLTNYLLPTSDLAQAWWWLVVAVLAAWLLGVATLIRAPATRTGRSWRLGRSPARFPGAALVTPIAVVLAFRVPEWADPTHGGMWQLLLLCCWALAIVGLPWSVAAVIRLINDVARAQARRAGRPGLLVAAANGSAYPAMLVRTVAVVGIAASVLMQVHYFTGMYQLRAREAIALAGELNGTMLITTFQSGHYDLTPVTDALPEVSLVQLRRGTGHHRATVIGDCAGLSLMELPCRNGPSPANAGVKLPWLLLEAGVEADDVDVKVLAPGEKAVTDGPTVLAAVAGAPVDEVAFKQVLYATAWPWYAPQPPVFGYAGNAFANIQQNQWVLLFGVVALAEFLAAAVLAALVSFGELARRLAPMVALSARGSPTVVAALYLLMGPTILGGLAAVGLGWTLVQVPVRANMAPQIEPALLLLVSGVVIVTGVGAAIFAMSVASRTAQRWRPGGPS